MALRRRCFRVQIVSSHGVFTKYVEADVFNLGRSDEADIAILETTTSRDHLTVYSKDSEIVVEDKNSTHGTFVNGERMQKGVSYRYRQGDPIKMGRQLGFVRIHIVPKYLTMQEELAADPDFAHRMVKTSVTQNLNNWIKEKIASNESASANNAEADTLVDHNVLSQAPTQKALEEQMRRVLAETQAMAQQMNAEASADAEMLLKQARNTANEVMQEAEEKAKVTRHQLKIESQEIQKALDLKAEQLKATAQIELNQLKAATTHEAEQIKIKAQSEAQLSKENAEKQMVQILGQAQLERQKIKAEGEAEVQALREQIEKAALDEKAKIEQLAEAKAQDTLRQAQSIKDDLLKGVTMQVDVIKKKAEDEGHAQVAALKAQAEKDRESMIEMARKQSADETAKAIGEARNIAARTVEEARDAATKIMHEARTASEKLTIEAEKKVRDLETFRNSVQADCDALLKQKATAAQDIEAEVLELKKAKTERKAWLDKTTQQNQELLEKTEKKAQEIVAKAQHQAEAIVKAAEADAVKRIDNIKGPAERERDLLLEETRTLQEQKLQLSAAIIELKKNREKFAEESQELFKAKERVKVQTEIIEQEYAKTKGDKEKLIAQYEDQILKQKQTIEQQSFKLQSAQEREAQARKIAEEFDKKFASTKQEAEKTALRRQTIDAEIQRMIEKAQADCRDMKKQEEHALSVLRLKEMDAAKVRAEQEDAVRFKEQHQHAKELNLRLKQAFAGKVTEVLKSPHPDLAEKELVKQVGKIIDMVFNNESLTAENELKSLLSFNPEVAQGIQRFWRRAIAATVVILILVGILINNRHWFGRGKQWLANRAASNNEQTAKYYEKIENEREERRKFRPEQKPELHDTYADSVIFTEAFIEIYQEEEFQKTFISSTNELFVKKLRLDENSVPPFIGAESSLIDQLIEMREEINGEFPEEGIAKMRELEQGTRPALIEMIGGEKNFSRYWKFREKFFSNCVKERSERAVTSEEVK